MLIPSIHERKSWLSVLLVLIIGLNLYFNFSYKGSLQERASWLDEFFGKVFLPVQFLVSGIHGGVVGSAEYIQELIVARSENKKLKEQLAMQKLDISLVEELRRENERLRDLLTFSQSKSFDYLVAQVIAVDPSAYFKTMVLDRGTSDGVERDMPVVSTQGVIGRVLEVSRWTSKVLLLTDINSRIDAVVQRSRARTIVAGSIDGGLRLQYLPRRQNLQEGDVLVTSGLAGRYPPGFYIGTIETIEKNANFVLEEASLEASVDFDTVEEVFIVKSANKKEG